MESEKNPIDVKRDEFRKYLERTGALEAVSKAFTKLFECEERPENTIDFIKQNLGDETDETETVDNLKKQIAEYREEIASLTKKLKLINENMVGGSSSVTSEESTEVKQENSELPESDVKPESSENVEVKPAEPEASTSGIESTSTAAATPKESEPKKPQEEN